MELFEAAGVHDLLELGAGQGRDTLLFLAAGLLVTALDFAADGLEQIARKARAAGVAGAISSVPADVRAPLPLETASFDACYSHMLFSIFIVHFFDRDLIERLARGFELVDVAEYEEGRLPRRLFAVTMRRR